MGALLLLAVLLAPAGSENMAPHGAAPIADGATTEGTPWTGSLSVYTYFVPGDRNYASPTVRADRGRLHLEARWNYEDLDTASLWAGANLAGGEEIEWAITTMVGGVFGETDGVAPGYEGSLDWRWLGFYSEGEYVIDLDDSSENWFYTWSEATLAPVEAFRGGFVVQRTRAYETEVDTQRGLLAAVTGERFDASVILFNLDESEPTVVVALAIEF